MGEPDYEAEWSKMTDRLIAVRAERDRLAAALADRDAQVTRVRALHQRVEDDDGGYCTTCVTGLSHEAWPCPTVRALDGAGDEPRPPVLEVRSESPTSVAAEPTGDEPPTEPRCTHWHVHPLLSPVRCTRPASHPLDRREPHVFGAESWNTAAGEYRPERPL
jgi:hypothetical protein